MSSPTQKLPYDQIIPHFEFVRKFSDLGKKLCNQWVTADAWVKAINARALIPAHMHVDTISFNRAMRAADDTGIIRLLSYYTVTYYYVATIAGVQQKKRPKPDKEWVENVAKAEENALGIYAHQPSRNTTCIIQQPADDRHATDTATDTDDTDTDEQTATNKRPRTTTATTTTHNFKKTAAALRQLDYWSSSEAQRMFAPKENETTKEALIRRIEILRNVNATDEGWRDIIIEDNDPDNLCTMSDIQNIRERAMMVCKSCIIALKDMNRKTWKDCCQEAVDTLNELGFVRVKTASNINKWHRTFLDLGGFPHPKPDIIEKEKQEPQLLREYPAIKEAMLNYCVTNLSTLTMKNLNLYLWDEAIPTAFATWKRREEEERKLKKLSSILEEPTVNEFLKSVGLKLISRTTMSQWIKDYGIKYKVANRTFYIDNEGAYCTPSSSRLELQFGLL